MLCLFTLLVASTEDNGAVGVEKWLFSGTDFVCADGDGEFSSWFSRVRGGKLTNL